MENADLWYKGQMHQIGGKKGGKGGKGRKDSEDSEDEDDYEDDFEDDEAFFSKFIAFAF